MINIGDIIEKDDKDFGILRGVVEEIVRVEAIEGVKVVKEISLRLDSESHKKYSMTYHKILKDQGLSIKPDIADLIFLEINKDMKIIKKSHSKYGVHKAHCCVEHGCKYGDIDCPVVNNEIVQDYICEYCEFDGIETVEQLNNNNTIEDVTNLWGLDGWDKREEFTGLIKHFCEEIESSDGEGPILELDLTGKGINLSRTEAILEELGYERVNSSENGWQWDYTGEFERKDSQIRVDVTGYTFEIKLSENV